MKDLLVAVLLLGPLLALAVVRHPAVVLVPLLAFADIVVSLVVLVDLLVLTVLVVSNCPFPSIYYCWSPSSSCRGLSICPCCSSSSYTFSWPSRFPLMCFFFFVLFL